MPLCEYCRPHVALATENDMQQHISDLHPFRCTLCPDSLDFGSHYTWIGHYTAQHPTRCPYCDAIVGEANRAKRTHFTQVHDYHPCTICMYCFETAAELLDHYASPAASHMHVCARCSKTLVNNQDFWFHCFEEHRGCPLCDWDEGGEGVSDEQMAWKEHLRAEHKLVVCSECFEVFGNDYEGNAHFVDKHRVSCSQCAQHFPDEDSKTKHYNTNHRYICPTCNLTFPNSTLKQEHTNAAHRITCSACGAYYDTNIEFELHYIESHRFPCTNCPQSFPTNELLELHTKLTHKYLCDVCEEYLDQSETLRYHYDVVHRVKCDLCAKVCGGDGELRLHYAGVHGVGMKQVENRYVCSVCQDVCGSEQMLVKHYKDAHLKLWDQWDVSPPRGGPRRAYSNAD